MKRSTFFQTTLGALLLPLLPFLPKPKEAETVCAWCKGKGYRWEESSPNAGVAIFAEAGYLPEPSSRITRVTCREPDCDVRARTRAYKKIKMLQQAEREIDAKLDVLAKYL